MSSKFRIEVVQAQCLMNVKYWSFNETQQIQLYVEHMGDPIGRSPRSDVITRKRDTDVLRLL